jgi:hypothetical protein
MPKLSSVFFLFLLLVSGESMMSSRLQQNEKQNASPRQEAQPMSRERQVISTSSLQNLAGCVVRSDRGYSLKTEKGTYPIDTEIDLSNFVEMQVKVTGALEYHSAAAPPAVGAKLATASTLHIRKIGWVIGTCNESAK